MSIHTLSIIHRWTEHCTEGGIVSCSEVSMSSALRRAVRR